MEPHPDWFDRVPKVELHVHLSGALPREALWQLIQKYGGDPSVPSFDALDRRFQYHSFPDFIDAWIWKNQYIREYEDFTFFSEAVARELSRQNVRYAEVFFSPSRFAEAGLEPQRLAEAIRAGLSKVPQVEIALIADLVRDYGPDSAAIMLRQVHEARDQGIIGIGIGGSEHRFPPELFGKVYDEARQLGFRTTAHAGEATGAESVWNAIRILQVERIGHGVRAGEDEKLVEFLAERQIPLEMCPHSNVCTRVIDSVEEHPIRRYFDRGLLVTANTDDPLMFGNSLSGEYRLLHEKLGFSQDEIRTLILNGIRASWLSDQRKREMAYAFIADRAWSE